MWASYSYALDAGVEALYVKIPLLADQRILELFTGAAHLTYQMSAVYTLS